MSIATIPEYIKLMSTKNLLGEIKLYKMIFTERRGGISRPGHEDYNKLWEEYQWFHEELGSRS
jgi:hypothetical protein